MTTVVAGLIERDGRVLVCRRRADQKHPLKWEFPGGKAEAGEDPPAALERELEEELGIRIDEASEITRFEHRYGDSPPILLIFYHVGRFRGRLENRIFAEMEWVERKRLGELDFLEGDVDFVRRWAGATLSEP